MLLKGWREWGEDLPTHLYGMFAFVLRDGAAHGALPRPAGHQAAVPDGRRGADRLDAAGAAGGAGGVDTRVDPVALHHYLSWHAVVPAPRTILRGVTKLPPATLRVDRAGRPAP